MTNKLKDAINQIMTGYDLTETGILMLIAAGADETRKRALIDSDGETERKMQFVRGHAEDLADFMEGRKRRMTATQFINRYITGPYALYRRIHGCDLPGDVHEGPSDIPEDADYMEVIEIKACLFRKDDWQPFIGIICRRINE